MNESNPPPSKSFRSKLASVNSASKRAKNTKNLYLNVNSNSINSSSATSNHDDSHFYTIPHMRQKSPKLHKTLSSTTPNNNVDDYFPPSTPFVANSHNNNTNNNNSTSKTVTPLQSPSSSKSPSLLSTCSSTSSSPTRPCSVSPRRQIPPQLPQLNTKSITTPTSTSHHHHDLGRPSALSISIPEDGSAEPLKSPIAQPTAHNNNNWSALNDKNTVVIPPSSDLSSPTDRAKMDEDAYPNGPLLVCPPNVYLYSEPTIDLAYQYDVVINVAKEVGNPFNGSNHHSTQYRQGEDQSGEGAPVVAISPDGSSEESQSSNCSSPTGEATNATNSKNCLTSPPSSVESTPDLSVSPSKPVSWNTEPEYIYVPWDHNSRLTRELNYLTSVIDARSRQGKKILIHCQCGVSRSASLVVAYVMRKNGWDLNTAYSYVKNRSPNISPNMNLMFQLIDWQKVLQGDVASSTSSTSSSSGDYHAEDELHQVSGTKSSSTATTVVSGCT